MLTSFFELSLWWQYCIVTYILAVCDIFLNYDKAMRSAWEKVGDDPIFEAVPWAGPLILTLSGLVCVAISLAVAPVGVPYALAVKVYRRIAGKSEAHQ